VKSAKKYLGFDDKWLMIFGIPLVWLIVTLIIFGPEVFTAYPQYCIPIGLTFTISYWVVMRKVIINYHQVYPGYEFTKSRLIYIISRIILAYLFVKITVNIILDLVVPDAVELFMEDNMQSFIKELTELVIISLVFFIYEGIYYLNKSREIQIEKNELQKITAEQKLDTLKNQVNPHFLFNSLNTLVTMIPEEPKLAIDFVQKLSKTYRNILDVRDEKLITIRQEMKALDSYIYLLKTRFQGKIQIFNHLEDSVLDKFILPLSIQILLENAVKHNITSSRKPLSIGISEEDGHIVVRNKLQRKEQKYNSTKMGLANIRSRYKLLIGKDIVVDESDGSFTVKLPIIENSGI